MNIEDELRKLNGTLYRSFMRLTGEQQERIKRMYARHVAACEKTDCMPDPRFFYEVIDDMRRGLIPV
jgi:hypothetical protein